MSDVVGFLDQIGVFILFLGLVGLVVLFSKIFRTPKKDKSAPTDQNYNNEPNK